MSSLRRPSRRMPLFAGGFAGGACHQMHARPTPIASSLRRSAADVEEKRRRLIAMDRNEVRGCTKCRLCETRTHTVFGEGDPDAKIFFIGEGPGENEDLTGPARSSDGRANCSNKMIRGDGVAARAGVYRQHRQMPSAGQSRAGARRSGDVHALSRAATGNRPAEGDRHARPAGDAIHAADQARRWDDCADNGTTGAASN